MSYQPRWPTDFWEIPNLNQKFRRPSKSSSLKKNPPAKQFDTVDGSEILRSPVEVSSLHYFQIFDMFDTSQVVMVGFQQETPSFFRSLNLQVQQ